jgi:hypothetical protein
MNIYKIKEYFEKTLLHLIDLRKKKEEEDEQPKLIVATTVGISVVGMVHTEGNIYSTIKKREDEIIQNIIKEAKKENVTPEILGLILISEAYQREFKVKKALKDQFGKDAATLSIEELMQKYETYTKDVLQIAYYFKTYKRNGFICYNIENWEQTVSIDPEIDGDNQTTEGLDLKGYTNHLNSILAMY